MMVVLVWGVRVENRLEQLDTSYRGTLLQDSAYLTQLVKMWLEMRNVFEQYDLKYIPEHEDAPTAAEASGGPFVASDYLDGSYKKE